MSIGDIQILDLRLKTTCYIKYCIFIDTSYSLVLSNNWEWMLFFAILRKLFLSNMPYAMYSCVLSHQMYFNIVFFPQAVYFGR